MIILTKNLLIAVVSAVVAQSVPLFADSFLATANFNAAATQVNISSGPISGSSFLVTSGTVDVVGDLNGTTLGSCGKTTGNNCLVLNGTIVSNQTYDLRAGVTNQVSFDVLGGPNTAQLVNGPGSASLTNTQFLNLAYNDILRRSADSGGLAYWQGELDGKLMNRSQLVQAFTDSAEYQSLPVQTYSLAASLGNSGLHNFTAVANDGSQGFIHVSFNYTPMAEETVATLMFQATSAGLSPFMLNGTGPINNLLIDNIQFDVVAPEPGTWLLAGGCLLGGLAYRRRIL